MISILHGDWIDQLKTLSSESVHCCVTSPPYWGLRDYGMEGQLGLEKTHQEYVAKIVSGFQQVRRVIRDDGTLWLNLGDSYAGYHGNSKVPNSMAPSNKNGYIENMRDSTVGNGLKPKDLVGIPWRVAFALQTDGWYLRSDIIWHKPNPMPESVTDRPTKAHEYIFLLSKSQRYFYDTDAIREPYNEESLSRYESAMMGTSPQARQPNVDLDRRHREKGIREPNPLGRQKRSVWTVNTNPYPEAHFATFPEDLIKPCILAGCPVGGTVLDPFLGSGTTGKVALELGRKCIGIELNPEYVELAERRTFVTPGLSL